jgi:hypothetical protein
MPTRLRSQRTLIRGFVLRTFDLSCLWVGMVLCLSGNGEAQTTRNWTGAVSTFVNAAGNWEGNIVPNNGENAAFGAFGPSGRSLLVPGSATLDWGSASYTQNWDISDQSKSSTQPVTVFEFEDGSAFSFGRPMISSKAP